jgi:hypothetical protein
MKTLALLFVLSMSSPAVCSIADDAFCYKGCVAKSTCVVSTDASSNDTVSVTIGLPRRTDCQRRASAYPDSENRRCATTQVTVGRRRRYETEIQTAILLYISRPIVRRYPAWDVFFRVNGHDPSIKVMRRLRRAIGRARLHTECLWPDPNHAHVWNRKTGRSGVAVDVGPIRWLRSTMVECRAGWQTERESAEHFQYRLDYRRSRWIVVGKSHPAVAVRPHMETNEFLLPFRTSTRKPDTNRGLVTSIQYSNENME